MLTLGGDGELDGPVQMLDLRGTLEGREIGISQPGLESLTKPLLTF